MIIKGKSRNGPRQLGRYLSRTDKNERVELLQLVHPIPDLTAAFSDWQMLAGATRGECGLYHAQISPHARYPMTADQWRRTVEVLEEELGFKDQPRAVVLHEKDGRQHLHVVWSRTDIDTMTLRSDSQNYAAHERASNRLELEFGHELVPGKHTKRDRDRQEEPPRAAISDDERHQAERTGIDPRARKSQITALFGQCDTGPAFKAALEDAGYILAKGDRRDFVLVDERSETLSLGRQLIGVTARDLREFMTAVDRAGLPTEAQARELQESRRADIAPPVQEQQETRRPAEEPPAATADAASPLPGDDDDLSRQELRRLEQALTERHAREADEMRRRQRNELWHLRNALRHEIQEKIGVIRATQAAERDGWQRAARARRKGIWGFIDAVQSRLNPVAAAEKTLARRKEFTDMKARQRQERADELVLFKQTRDQELQALKERHEDARRAHGAQYAPELDRYTREHHAARQLLREIEERRRAELEARDREGPERGPPGVRP